MSSNTTPERLRDAFEVEGLRLKIRGLLESLVESVSGNFEVHGALLDAKGDLVDVVGPNALHYTALEACVKASRKYLPLKNGETIITNDPYCGNTRLCDLVLIQGAFGKTQANELRYHVALQISVESLIRKNVTKIFESVEDEGYRIPPTLLDHGISINEEIVKYLCQSKTPQALLTSALSEARVLLKKAGQNIISIEHNFGRDKMGPALEELNKYSEGAMKRALHEIPDGEYSAFDTLENDGIDAAPVRIQSKLTVRGENVLVGFSGSSKQVKGPFNCNYPMTLGACFWVFRSLVKLEIPINAGAFKAFSVEAPDGTVVNARYPGALLGGYYETTKRIVDTLCLVLNKALPSQYPAQNGGSSNIATVAFENEFFVITLGCGSGGTKDFNGTDCVRAELHNFKGLSVEEIESRYPIQITHSGIREASGGDGKFAGGQGLTRGYRFLKAGMLTVLADRHGTKARGFFGGTSGLPGETMLMRNSEKKKIQNEKWMSEVGAGDTLVINTPGGGGWGKKDEETS